jgi:hypothetical protein
MLVAYLDESYDPGNAGYYAVAGVVGDSWMVLECGKKWRTLLTKHHLRKFKIAKMKTRPNVVTEFAKVVRDSGFFAFGLITKQAEVLEHLKGSALAKQYKEGPYMLLYQFSFIRLAMKFRKLGATESVSFVCDENARYLPMMVRSYPELRSINKLSEPYMGSCGMEKDDECIPLQMADLIAGEIRKNAPTWTQGNKEFTAALQVLLESETLGWVSLLDEGTLALVRQLVDSKHPQPDTNWSTEDADIQTKPI